MSLWVLFKSRDLAEKSYIGQAIWEDPISQKGLLCMYWAFLLFVILFNFDFVAGFTKIIMLWM